MRNGICANCLCLNLWWQQSHEAGVSNDVMYPRRLRPPEGPQVKLTSREVTRKASEWHVSEFHLTHRNGLTATVEGSYIMKRTSLTVVEVAYSTFSRAVEPYVPVESKMVL